MEAVAQLTAGSPPLAFFAGVTAVSLISIRHLAEWTVPVPVPVPVSQTADRADEPASAVKRFLPTIWTTVRGQVNAELYQRAAGWVKGELKARSGITAVRARLMLRSLLRTVLTGAARVLNRIRPLSSIGPSDLISLRRTRSASCS